MSGPFDGSVAYDEILSLLEEEDRVVRPPPPPPPSSPLARDATPLAPEMGLVEEAVSARSGDAEPAPLPFGLRYVPPSLSTFFALLSAAATAAAAAEVPVREKVPEVAEPRESAEAAAAAAFEDSSDDNNNPFGDIVKKVGPRRSLSGGQTFRNPPLVELLHGIVRLQTISPGRSLGYRGKLSFVRRAYTRLRSYSKNSDLMSVFAVYSALGGTSAGSHRFQDIKEFIVYETGILVGNAFLRNQEEMMKFFVFI